MALPIGHYRHMRLLLLAFVAAGSALFACTPASDGGGGGGLTPGPGSGAQAGSGGSKPPASGSGGAAAGASGGQTGSGGAEATGGAAGSGATPEDAGVSVDSNTPGGMVGGDAGPQPTPTPLPPGAGGTAQVRLRSALGLGYYTACHLVPGNDIRCFGDKHPRTMPPGGLKPQQITCAHDGCCALMPKGMGARVRCWSDKRTIFPPADVAMSVDAVQIVIGYQHGCALNTDASVTCWGQPGTMNAPPAGIKAKSLYAAAYFTCAVKMDDTVACWGVNPPLPPADLKAKLVSAVFHGAEHLELAGAGTRHACAIQLDDTVKCWGDNVDGTTDVPADLGPVRDIGTNSFSTCAVRPAGEVVCWGTRKYNMNQMLEKPMPAGIKLKAIKGQFAAYCGIQLDDTIACWGYEKTSHLSVPAGTKAFIP